jgi:hypothetical protein
MKKTTITCDFCEKIIHDGYITIGSTSEKDFKFENKNAVTGKIRTMGHFYDLHFCNEAHFIDYFFNRAKK